MIWASLGLFKPIQAEEVNDPPTHSGKKFLHQEPLGLFQSSDFLLTTGNCKDCGTFQQALWYFQNEVIAIPKVAQGTPTSTPLPFLVWLGSSEVLQHVRLDESTSHLITTNDTQIPLTLAPKIPSNRSYYDHSTSKFLHDQPLRTRGHFQNRDGTRIFVVNMFWPETFRLDLNKNSPDGPVLTSLLTDLIEDQEGGAAAPFLTKLLWERQPGTSRNWPNRAVLGFMLNGAQGDDDEAHGGHFGLVTGYVGAEGQMSHWMMNNFYDLDVESEKGIIPSMLPMDHYLMDLNSGQSYYRPSYLLIAILQEDRIAKKVQATAQQTFEALYRHDFLYHHAKANCTGLSIDILRNLGWNIPMKGATSYLKAIGAFYYVAATQQSLVAGEKVYDYLTQEQTRLFPRMAFQTIGKDLLGIVNGTTESTERTLTQFERFIQDDVEAIVFVRIPQIPSSRAFGTYPVLTFDDYEKRVPKDRSEWQVVPVAPRPFPETFQDETLPIPQLQFFTPIVMFVVFPITIVCFFMLFTLVRLRR